MQVMQDVEQKRRTATRLRRSMCQAQVLRDKLKENDVTDGNAKVGQPNVSVLLGIPVMPGIMPPDAVILDSVPSANPGRDLITKAATSEVPGVEQQRPLHQPRI